MLKSNLETDLENRLDQLLRKADKEAAEHRREINSAAYQRMNEGQRKTRERIKNIL